MKIDMEMIRRQSSNNRKCSIFVTTVTRTMTRRMSEVSKPTYSEAIKIWQQGWISSKFPLRAVISKRLDGPNILRPQELDFQ